MLARGLLLVTLSAPLALLPFATSSARAENGPVIQKANSNQATKPDYWNFPLLPLTSSGSDSGECKGGGGSGGGSGSGGSGGGSGGGGSGGGAGGGGCGGGPGGGE